MPPGRFMPLGLAGVVACLIAGLLTPAAAQDFRVEPYLQNPASDSVTIRWLSETANPGTVSVGGQLYSSTPVAATTLGYQPDEPASDQYTGTPWLHSLRVTGLAANAAHAYSVTQGASTRTGVIQTPLAAGPAARSPGQGVRLFVYGDSETEPESAAKRTDWNPSLAAGRSTLAAVVGDLVESGGEQRDWDEFWRHNAGPLATGGFDSGFAGSTPIVPALGNHENYGGPGSLGGYSAAAAAAAVEKYRTYFELPDNAAAAADHTGRYHRVDFGPVTLITIDSSSTGTDGTADDTNFFLAAARDAGQITLVQYHHAAYSSGAHGRPAGSDPGAVTSASWIIERILQESPEVFGESRGGELRVGFEPPLAVRYSIS